MSKSGAIGDAAGLPKTPLARVHNPQAEKEIRNRMGQHAGTETARAIGDEIVESAGDCSCRPIGRRMHEHKADGDSGEREP